jgi:hypothetical protein
MVRGHAYWLYRDKPPVHPLTPEAWVLAEKHGSSDGSGRGGLGSLVRRNFCTASLRAKNPSNV